MARHSYLQKLGLGSVAAPTLAALGGTFTLPENASEGAVAGTITGNTAGSTLSLTDDAGGRVALSGTSVVRGSTSLDYETATSHSFTVQEVLAGATNTPLSSTLTLNVTDVLETAPATMSFGALTPAGSGGVPITGTSITSDASGHWQIITDSANFGTPTKLIAPSTAGAAAGLNAGPYTVVTDTATLTITIEANVINVRTQTEWYALAAQLSAANAASWASKKAKLRPDSYRGGNSIVTGVDAVADILKGANFGGFTIEGDTLAINTGVFPPVRASDPCTVDKFDFRNSRNITLRKLAFTRLAEQKIHWKSNNVSTPVTGIVIDQCSISGVPADLFGDYSVSTNYPNRGISMVNNTGSSNGLSGSSTITNCLFEWSDFLLTVGADLVGDATITITGNYFTGAYSDGPHLSNGGGGAATTIVCTDNIVTNALGKTSDNGGNGPHDDGIQVTGSTTGGNDIQMTFERNIIWNGNSRGVYHGILAQYIVNSGVTQRYFNGSMSRNIYIGDNLNGFKITGAGDVTVDYNTCVQYDERLTANTTAITVGGTTTALQKAGAVIEVKNNVSDYLSTYTGQTVSNNVVLGKGGFTIPYSTAFAGSGGTFQSTPPDLATLLARFAPKAGGPLDTSPPVGAIGNVNWPTTVPGNNGSSVVAPTTMKAAYSTVHGGPSTSATNYAPPVSGTATSSISSSNSQARTLHGVAGTIKNLAVRAGNALTVGSYAVTLRVSGVDSALTATVDSSNQISFDSTHSISVLATDDIDFKIVPTGTPTAMTRLQIAWEFDSNSLSVPMFAWEVATTATANFFLPGTVSGGGATEIDSTGVMPCSGTFAAIGVRQSGAPGTGTANIFTLRKNGADSALTNSVTDTNTSVAVGGTPVTVAAGDTVSLGRTLTGTPANASLGICLVWTPDNPGDMPTFGNITGTNYTTGGRFGPVRGSNLTSETTESNAYNLVPVATTLSALRFAVSAAPGAGQSRTATLRKTTAGFGATSTIASVTLTTLATDADTDSITFAAGDLTAVQYDVTGTPATTTYSRVSMISRVL